METKAMLEKMDKLNEELELNEQIAHTDDNENDDMEDVNTDQIAGRQWAEVHDIEKRLSNPVEQLSDNRELIERCLQRLRAYDKIPSDEEWQSMEGLCECLEIFRTATYVLSGAAYATSGFIPAEPSANRTFI